MKKRIIGRKEGDCIENKSLEAKNTIFYIFKKNGNKNVCIYDFHCHTRSFLYNWDLSDL